MKYIVAVISALAILAAVLPAPASATALAVPVRIQEQDQWCWAGCTQAILFYYGHTVTQTAIAQYGTQGRNLPNYGWGSGWSGDGQTWCRGNDMILNHFGSINSTGRTYPLDQNTVTSEINAGRPFIITWEWDSGGGHFIVGRGISGDTFYYMDPWTGIGHRTSTYDWVKRNASHGHTWTQSLQLTTNPPAPATTTRAPLQVFAGDFSGNGASQTVIFRPSTGLWAIRNVGNYFFGQSGDIPVPADYNNNGRSDIAIFRPSTGLWAVRGVTRVFYGQAGDIPVPADYNGDGRANIAIFRPSSGVWRFRDYFGPGQHGHSYFGQNGDIPVPGDYNNSGQANWAIFRPSTGLWASSCGLRAYYGRSGDIPVPMNRQSGNYVVPAIFRPSTGLWSVRGQYYTYHGRDGDIPVPARWYGAEDRYAIFRPSTGLWSIWNGANYYFGRAGDIPATR